MKTVSILCALATGAFAGPPVLVHITPQALAKIQQADREAALQKPTVADASAGVDPVTTKPSSVLHDGKNWTIVPTGAVIFIPDAMKSKVDVKPVGKLLSFDEFLAINKNWITTSKVSFDQAAGNEDLPMERVSFWAKQDKIVIAVHQGGPASVRISTDAQSFTQR
jgi:hypothetical protein